MRSLAIAILAVCFLATTAEARPRKHHHRHHHHVHKHHKAHKHVRHHRHVRRHRHARRHHHRRVARRGSNLPQWKSSSWAWIKIAGVTATVSSDHYSHAVTRKKLRFSFDRPLLARARADLGKTASQMGLHRRTLWCAAAMNKWTGGGTGSDLAKSYIHYGSRGTGAVGDIAVLSRRGGGHVGIVAGSCDGGVLLISGNHGHRVAKGCYPRSRVIAYRRP